MLGGLEESTPPRFKIETSKTISIEGTLRPARLKLRLKLRLKFRERIENINNFPLNLNRRDRNSQHF